MMVKIYGMLWLALAVLAAVIFVAGSMTLTVVVAFGFVAFGMVFMGMMGVLPTLVSHPVPHQTVAETKEPERARDRLHIRHSAHA